MAVSITSIILVSSVTVLINSLGTIIYQDAIAVLSGKAPI